MQYFVKYLSTAPILLGVWLTVQGLAIMEFNHLFPDLLFHPLP